MKAELPEARAGALTARPRPAPMNNLYAALILGTCVWSTAAAPVVGVPLSVGTAIVSTMRARQRRAIGHMASLFDDGRVEESARQIDAIDRMRLFRDHRAWFERCRSLLQWERGELALALAAAERCEVHVLGGTAMFWDNRFAQATLALELDDARAMDLVALAREARAAHDVERRRLDAHVAFALGRSDALGTDDELRARAAGLHGPRSVHALAALAWALSQRGLDAGEHLRAVRARVDRARAPRMYPRLWAWLGPQLDALPP